MNNGSDLDCQVNNLSHRENYELLVAILVGDLWWTKPTYDYPATPLTVDGHAMIPVVTGGYDQYATGYMVWLVPIGYKVTLLKGVATLPVIPEALATAQFFHGPAVKTLSFAGYTWTEKHRDFPSDPGQNFWSDATGNVWVDSAGLHLTYKKVGDVWYASEVTIDKSLGRGTYKMQVHGRLDNLDPHLIAAPMFTYEMDNLIAGHRELDFEFAKWLIATDQAQFVSQPIHDYPWGSDPHGVRYSLVQTDEACDLTLILVWGEGWVEFKTYYGKWIDSDPPASSLVRSWVYDGSDVPTPGQEKVHCNFWAVDSNGPADGKDREFVITDFKFSSVIPPKPTPTPTPTPTPVPTPSNLEGRLAPTYIVTTPSIPPGSGQAVSYTYKWTSDTGKQAIHGPKADLSDTLNDQTLVVGETWMVTVTPRAGDVNGSAQTAKVKIVSNQAGVLGWIIYR